MADKNRISKLQDLDFVGTQETISPIVRKRMERLTGKIFRSAKAMSPKTTPRNKKTS
jgi:hypothetical protein